MAEASSTKIQENKDTTETGEQYHDEKCMVSPLNTPKKSTGGAMTNVSDGHANSADNELERSPAKITSHGQAAIVSPKPEDLADKQHLICDLFKAGKSPTELARAMESTAGKKPHSSVARRRRTRNIEPAMSNVKDEDRDVLAETITEIDNHLANYKLEFAETTEDHGEGGGHAHMPSEDYREDEEGD